MNFSHYKGLVDVDKVQRFIFAQGNRPAAEMLDGSLSYLSETFLFKEDMEVIYEEISSVTGAEDRNTCFIEGKKFFYQELKLNDSSQLIVYPQGAEKVQWKDMLKPGYVNDWVEARSGILVFYGSDPQILEQVRLAFSYKRTESIKGTSLVFSRVAHEDHVGKEGHFLTSSTDEAGFVKSSSKLIFDSYSFTSDVPHLKPKFLLRLADQGSLVVVNSEWGDLAKVWSEIHSSFEDENERNFFFESIVGFVGVQKVETSNIQGEVVFEALPMLKQESYQGCPFNEQLRNLRASVKENGVSFNQSIHSLVLKRKISLENAYKVSLDPEELNQFLSESGV